MKPRWARRASHTRLHFAAGGFLIAWNSLAMGLLPAMGLLGAEPPLTGQQIYQQQCASCHGAQGEGVADKYDEPLYGDRSLDDLTKIIDETMPEEKPELCTGEAARSVARYMMEAFYTAEARARNQPPRIELSRLTVPQYQNAIADLLGSFSDRPVVDERRGLNGQYYDARNFRREKRVLEQVDPTVELQFGEESPQPGKIGKDEFSIRWQGSVIIEETGDYEFALRTENGARLWINDPDTPLIDQWVASGGEVKQHAETIRLLAGRAYPLKIEFFKFKDKSASIALQWKPPAKVWATIPERHLTPAVVPPSMIVTTPFPPDDSSVGYERGTAVSKAWHEATTFAAIEVARWVVEHLDGLSRSKPDSSDRLERLKAFGYRFAEVAFRRPLTDEQRRFFVDDQFQQAVDAESAIKRVVLLVLKSPRFLYLDANGPDTDDYDVASRLAFGLWDSLPDATLLQAAAVGQLRNRDEVVRQAARMLEDGRARAKLRQFFQQWLEFDAAEDIAKDGELFPGFDETLVADLRTSLEMFLDHVMESPESDYRQLLLAETVFVNDRLAKFYGLQPPPPGEFQPVTLDSGQRAGVVTHPFLLAALAYHKSSSPIHRGVFATRKLLGRSLKPPPMAIEFIDGKFDPHLTMREKVAELTSPMACQTCHSVINPLGFSLESFDAVGRYRTHDKDRPIDATSVYTTLTGESIPLRGARDLAQYAAGSEDAQRGFVEKLFHHVAKQPAAAYGPRTLEQLRQSFAESQFSIRSLLIELATVSALEG